MKFGRALLVLLWLISRTSLAQNSVKRELLELTEMSERRIRQGVQDFIGPDSRAVVSVYLKDKKMDPSVPETTTASVLPESEWVLSGPYVPEKQSYSGSASVEIESGEVSIQVERFVDAAGRKEIDRITKSILRGFPLKVNVSSSLPSPVAQIERERKATEDAGRKPASIESTFNEVLEKFTKLYGPFAPLAAAFILLAGAVILAVMLRNSASEIAAGLKSIRPTVSNTGSQKISLDKSVEAKPKESTNPLLSHPNPVSSLELKKNIQSIETYLFNAPLLLARSIGDHAADLMGVKYLVSKFSPEARLKLKELIGVEKILKAGEYQASVEVREFHAGEWLQQLIEKIEIRKIAGGTVVEEALSVDETLLLSNAPQEKMFEAAQKINTPAAWRVASDFLEKELFKKRVPTLDRQVWGTIVKSSLILEISEIHEAARALIEIVRFSVSENVVMSKSNRERDDHFTNQILPSLVDSLITMDLSEGDDFISFITDQVPEFKNTIHSRIWTASRLSDVSDDSLKSVFLGLDNERRAYLIYALPEFQKRRLESYLPEGNMKKIVADMVARMKTTGDLSLKGQTQALAREFLDYLRVQAANGKILLRTGNSNSVDSDRKIATEAEIVVEAAPDESEKKAS